MQRSKVAASQVRFIETQRETSVFVALTSLIALYIVFSPGVDNNWMLDPLTGVVAAATGLIVCARLALGSSSRPARQLWQAMLLVVALICISNLADDFSDRVQERIGVDVDDLLMLSAAPLFLWFSARFEPVPTAVRRMLWLAFTFQLLAVPAELYGEHRNALSDLDAWSLVTDSADFVSMQCYLLATALFVAYLRLQILAGNRGPGHVGDLARYLFVTRRLFKKQRYPRIAGFALPGGKAALEAGRFFVWFLSVGPRVRDEIGLSLWRQFVGICIASFRHGLDAQAYYMFELYRRSSGSRASGFLTRYETKNGLFKVLNWQIPKSRKRSLLGDKMSVYRMCEEHRIPHIPILMTAERGKLTFWQDRSALARDLFIKPRQLKGARETETLRYVDGKHMDRHGDVLGFEALLAYVATKSRSTSLLVQPRIVNHPGLADLAETSLIVLRVITCLDQHGLPKVTHGMLRVLCKLEPAWLVDLELGAPIDLGTGRLGRMTGDKAEMALGWFADHPVTGARVQGRIVPFWDQACALAVDAHTACADRLLVGWDIAISPDGALLVEGNAYADVDFLQRVARRSIGDSPLGPLLFDRLVDLESRIEAGTLRGPMDYDR
jgi:ribosomal protein L34